MSVTGPNSHWVDISLGDVVTLINGRAYKQPEMLAKGTPILRIQNLNGGDRWLFSDLALPPEKYCCSGDLLYAWSATFGPYIYGGPKAIFHYHIWNVIPSTAVCKQFAFYELLRVTDQIKRSAHGVAMPHITKAGMESWPLKLPPLPEQQRIADKLDTVLASVDAVNARLARVAPLLKRFRQSVLAAATSGRLTADWRRAVALSDLSESLGQLADIFGVREKRGTYNATNHQAPFLAVDRSLSEIGVVSGGLTKNSKRLEMPLVQPYLRVANVYANELRLNDIATIGMTQAELAKTRLIAGDLLLVEGNGSLEQIGRVALWDGSIDDCSHQNHLIRWRAGPEVLPKYVLFWLLSPAGRVQIEAIASSTTGLHTLSVSKVGALHMPIPSQAEQSEIVRRVELLFAFADRLEARLQAAQTATSRLTPSLLAKAFRGELVQQDPNDEPAAELLRRLAQTRPESTARGRKPRARPNT